MQVRDEAQDVRLARHNGHFVGNDGEALAWRGRGPAVDEEDLIGPHRRILHQEIAGIVGADLEYADLHERAFHRFVFFI